MNARFRKEVRSLAPWGGVTLALVLSLACWSAEWTRGILIAAFGLGCVVMGIGVFGREMGGAMSGAWFCQPVPRLQLWREKLGVAAGLLAIPAIILLFCGIAAMVSGKPGVEPTILPRAMIYAAMVLPFAGLAVGIFFTLWTKNVTASFWFSLLTLWMAVMGASLLGPYAGGLLGDSELATLALVLVTGLAWWAGRRLFLRYEDTGALSAEWDWPHMPGLAWIGRRNAGFAPRFATVAVVGKELRLQQITIFGLTAAYGLAALFYWLLPESRWTAGQMTVRESIPLLVRLIAVLAPLFIGAVAVAGERGYGTPAWHLCLPFSRWREWAIKLGVGLGLAWIYGGAVGLAIDRGLFNDEISPLPAGTMFALYFGVPAITALVGMYASSLSRNFLQAAGVGLILGLLCLGWFFLNSLWLIRLIELSSAAVLVVSFLAIPGLFFLAQGYHNHGRLDLAGGGWSYNALAFGITLAVTTAVAAAIYCRAWEPVLYPSPAKERYGQVAPPKTAPQIETAFEEASLVAPDGTLWHWGRDYRVPPSIHAQGEWRAMQWSWSDEPFQVGTDSDWVQVIHLMETLVALKSDGTLWRIGPNLVSQDKRWVPGSPPYFPELTRIGGDSDWTKMIGSFWSYFLLLKSDGSLWGMGWKVKSKLGQSEEPSEDNPRDLKEPIRLTESAGWIDAAQWNGVVFLLNEDGTIWAFGRHHPDSLFKDIPISKRGAVPEPVPWFTASTNIVALHASPAGLVARHRDGSSLIWPTRYVDNLPIIPDSSPVGSPKRLEPEVQWDSIEALGGFGEWIYRTKDGRLECMQPQWSGREYSVAPIAPIQGTHWSAVEAGMRMSMSILAMTSDGTLWVWGENFGIPERGNELRWLPPRRHPFPIANLTRASKPH